MMIRDLHPLYPRLSSGSSGSFATNIITFFLFKSIIQPIILKSVGS